MYSVYNYNAECIVCTMCRYMVHAHQSRKSLYGLPARPHPRPLYQSSSNPSSILHNILTTPMQWCYQPLYTILVLGPSFNFSNQSSNVNKEQWQSWSLLLYFSSEFNENSRSWDFSWKSAWFFLARPWEMIIFFSISPRNTRKKQKKLLFSFRSRRLKGKSSRSRKMRFLFKRKEVVWC